MDLDGFCQKFCKMSAIKSSNSPLYVLNVFSCNGNHHMPMLPYATIDLLKGFTTPTKR